MFRKIVKVPAAVIIAQLLLAVGLLWLYHRDLVANEFLGLGTGTTTYRPLVDSFPIHITESATSEKMIKGWQQRGSKELFLWFGNSQLHGVNQYQEGQKNCVEYCYYALVPFNKTVLGISYPNANFKELLLSVVYHSTRLPQVKRVVLPVFYDDMREESIRDNILTEEVRTFIRLDTLAEYFSTVNQLAELRIDQGTLAPMTATKTCVGHEKAEAEKMQTVQSTTETWLEHVLSENWTLWKDRQEIRSNLFYDLYNMRNYVLRINSATERKMIPGIFQENYRAFEQILAFCRDKKIQVILYIPPVRPDVKIPYNKNNYTFFKTDIERQAKLHDAVFLNLENIVPAKWWSQEDSRSSRSETNIDFMHFQEPGHKLLGDTIFSVLNN